MTTTTPAGAGERCPTCDLLKDDREGRYCSDAFHLPTNPAPELSGLEELMEKADINQRRLCDCDSMATSHAPDCKPDNTPILEAMRAREILANWRSYLPALLSALKAAGEERAELLYDKQEWEGEREQVINACNHWESKATSLQQENDRLRDLLGKAVHALEGWNVSPIGGLGPMRAELSPQGGDAE